MTNNPVAGPLPAAEQEEAMLELVASVWNIIWIIIAFSVLIFVHELGHYLAALLVGVRPERFFIGFDIYGLGIKKEYKGCVYGIGLLPLGGYVKLAGQSDDPREQQNGTGASDEYRSKPLWAQALIITAGVIMNLIFGFLLLFFAYINGMPQTPPLVGRVAENSAAYYADLRTGDRILSINGTPAESFEMINEFMAVNPRETFLLEVKRGDAVLQRQLRLQPGADLGIRAAGLNPPATAEVGELSEKQVYGEEYAKLLKKGDVFVEIAGRKVPAGAGSGDFVLDVIENNPGKILPAVVLRGGEQVKVNLPVLGGGTYDFGCSVAVHIQDVIKGSPAAEAGLSSNTVISGLLIDGKREKLLGNDDFSEKIRSRAYQPVEVELLRGTAAQKATLKPRFMAGNPEIPAGGDTLLGILVEPAKDAAGKLDGWTVKKVLADGPAAGLLQPGDVLTAVNGVALAPAGKSAHEVNMYFNDPASVGRAVADASCRELGLIVAGEDRPVMMRPRIALETGAPLIGILMETPTVNRVEAGSPAARFLAPGDVLVLTLLGDGGKTTTVCYTGPKNARREPVSFPTPAAMLQQVEKNALPQVAGVAQFSFLISKGVKKSVGAGEALSMAFTKSVDMSLTVYKILHRLATGQIAASNMSGPLGIIDVMKRTSESPDPLMNMIFLLALISINLAIFNLLPFPVLDGGHLLFIIIEAVRGNPPSERFREMAQYFGVVCLLSLMLYVTWNDISKMWNNFSHKSIVENAMDRKK